jgi:hypothetical protein
MLDRQDDHATVVNPLTPSLSMGGMRLCVINTHPSTSRINRLKEKYSSPSKIGESNQRFIYGAVCTIHRLSPPRVAFSALPRSFLCLICYVCAQ